MKAIARLPASDPEITRDAQFAAVKRFNMLTDAPPNVCNPGYPAFHSLLRKR
jgi:hypothetical protein